VNIAGGGDAAGVKATAGKADGAEGGTTASVTATDGHPFWVDDEKRWIDAGDLEPGMWLRTSAGTLVQITAVKAWTAEKRVHNLTVDDIHTYYVQVAGTELLVHNTGPCSTKEWQEWTARNSEPDHTVYHGLDADGNQIYAGSTTDIARRENQHIAKDYGITALEPVPDTGNLKKWQARAIEQVKIERVRESGLSREVNNVPIGQNNAIRPGRKIYEPAMNWARIWMNSEK
jgi:hypothetical protein